MNIPFADGVLMIRSEAINSEMLDSTMINNAVGASYDEMVKLKQALDILVGNFERRKRMK